MTLVDRIRDYRDLIEASFDNAVGAVETVHYVFVDMSVGVLREIGLPAGVADEFTERHRRAMSGLYEGVRTTNHELGALVVAQVELISGFARAINAEVLGNASPSEPAAASPGGESGIRVVERREPL